MKKIPLVRRLLSLLLVIIMVAGLLPTETFALGDEWGCSYICPLLR